MLIEILLVAASMTSLTSKSGAVRVRKRFTKSSAIEDGFDVPMKTLLTFVPPEFATSSESFENAARSNPQGAEPTAIPGPNHLFESACQSSRRLLSRFERNTWARSQSTARSPIVPARCNCNV